MKKRKIIILCLFAAAFIITYIAFSMDIPTMSVEYVIDGKSYKTNTNIVVASWIGVEADGARPIDPELFPKIEKVDELTELKLGFTIPPSSYSVECDGQTVEVVNYVIPLQEHKNGYFCEVRANWVQGDVVYAFYIE